MIRGLFYWIGGGLLTLVLFIVASILYPFMKRRKSFIHSFIHIWARVLIGFFCGVEIELIGRENIDSRQNYIIVSNHRSFTDILAVSAAFPIQFRWLAKRSLFKIPVVGLGMKMAGYIPVVRERSLSASKSLEKLKEVLKREGSVWIFPEGTRTARERLGSFKRGAFLLARDTGMGVLPVSLIGSDAIFRGPLRIRGKKMKIVVHEPVFYKSFVKDGRNERANIDEMIHTIRNIIQMGYACHAS